MTLEKTKQDKVQFACIARYWKIGCLSNTEEPEEFEPLNYITAQNRSIVTKRFNNIYTNTQRNYINTYTNPTHGSFCKKIVSQSSVDRNNKHRDFLTYS